MSDRVQEIIEELILTAPLDDIPSEEDRASAAKQIRQQIGRELLDKTGNAVSIPESNKWADGWNDCRDVISEACQLEEA